MQDKIESNEVPKPFILEDAEGNNYVDNIDRKIDKEGKVYYEVQGRNAYPTDNKRVLRIYDNNRIEAYCEKGGVLVKQGALGYVHQQMMRVLPGILKHFSIPALDFVNTAVVIPKKPPAIISSVSTEELPSHEFFIAAAKRAMELGDKVSSQQKGAHTTRGALIGQGSTYYDEGNSTRLNLFHALVDGSQDGYYPFAATTAYGLSLLTYIASNYDKLNKTELQRLYNVYKALAGDIPPLGVSPSSPEYRKALAKGLKAEVNEITALRERLSYGHSISNSLTQYRQDLVAGNPNGRAIVDRQTSFMASSEDDKTLTRDIPSFFPIPPSSGTTDQIVLQGGGCRTHSAIVSIWKQGVDKDGNPVRPGDGKTIERYRVYRTVSNAGFGTTYDIRTDPPALYHEIFSPNADGKTYSVCTQEVLLPVGVPYSDEAMQEQIAKLVDVERALLVFHDLPGKKGPNNEVGTLDAEKQAKWRKLNQSIRLGPVETTHSVLSAPQTTGNCTVRSIEEFLRWELIRKGVPQYEAGAILDKHWDFATHNDSASITAQLGHISAQIEIKKTEPLPPTEMNIVRAKSFFENPIIPVFPEYSPDKAKPSETASLVDEIRSGKKSCPKPTMISIGDLLGQIPDGAQEKAEHRVGLYLLQGCDARKAPAFSSMNGSVRQIASQFNNGESQGRYLTQPDNFHTDPTQGPAEQRTSGGAAIARYAHNRSCDSFAAILAHPALKAEFNNLFDYRFGYLTPKEGREEQGLAFLKKHINKLVLNVERVAIDGVPDQTAIQVLNSGLALGRYAPFQRTPKAVVHLSEMTEILLGAQYKAVAAVAILEAQQNPGKRIPVSFTMVGGSAFGNDKKAIAKSVSQAIKLVRESGVNNIDICLSIFTTVELAEYKKLAKEGEELADLRELLNKKPVTEAELQRVDSLQRTDPSRIEEPVVKNPNSVPGVKPTNKDELAPPLVKNKNYVNADVVNAMDAAIAALSKKSHLSTDSHQTKSDQLNNLKSLYENAASPQDADNYLLRFIIAASRQRESSWGSLFTSKFGETASAKAFFEHYNDSALKNRVLGAAQRGGLVSTDFKGFINDKRAKYEHREPGDELEDNTINHRL
ncbi:hypothetical protein BN59_01542 [Legionella massiliensis]|uniref:Uncharacterized protein n=1 Tax=Legionella massiliensis TaxID=1034943 RepID=A0A078KS22_9GAMM|nr:hypothetical protein [Legionella massiliensis]CDZ77260.1 hypothetical protein BN59_01542 [Legionella massiliensis]CEE12998.1 hypothetical protein BN1094_01542 [Legionella massiliensis]